jgi:hypothetical protein
MTQRLAVALVAVLSSNALAQSYAQPVIATGGDLPARPEQPAQHSIDGRVGMVLGGSDVGDANGFSMGVAGGLGYRIGDVTLRGTFDYYRVGDGSDEAQQRRGRASRFGAAARYSFANLGADSTAICDFWGELGAGYEHVDWMHGGVLDRPSVELALGFDFGGKGDRDRDGRRRSAGYYMAFRTFLAEAPAQPDAMATCGGPCDTATTPSRTDVTMFFDFGVHFGH